MSELETTVNQTSFDAAKTELSQVEKSAKTHAIVAYALMLLGFWTGLGFLIGGIWGMVKASDAKGTIFESHYANIKRTFWVSLILSIIGIVTSVFVVGWFIVVFAFFYTLYKVVKGLARVTSNKAY
ncbi:hypothetical protein SBW85_18445 [Vibrio plantisponsor]|jgi:uncharacterized membrane protein|uniref:DUF4870 domain-containing protein n=1 Tax=Vibrio plantisponsor TaxID=664643 RepID=A0ABU4IM88_9VIBR|nr:hypothetical protein [Vibrio plantisponsor]MDW6019685.1 hypothetical protein [Vibrio plantisponsor]NNM38985.1 hypothetical protein [Vibrio plantisponsor]PNH91129.1 hypothetical protein C1M56_02460 [Vibrio diazotrophicus]